MTLALLLLVAYILLGGVALVGAVVAWCDPTSHRDELGACTLAVLLAALTIVALVQAGDAHRLLSSPAHCAPTDIEVSP